MLAKVSWMMTHLILINLLARCSLDLNDMMVLLGSSVECIGEHTDLYLSVVVCVVTSW